MFYWVVKAVLWPILRVLFRPWAEGTDYVPRTGPAILASNHLSFSDHFFAPLPLPRKVIFLAKSEYFTGRGIKGLFSKAFFSGVGQIPVDRSGGEASERALKTGLRVLANGQLLGIYPEGTRTPDGRLFRGKTGVARLALEARVPVIPCAMIGGFEFQPPGKIRPRLRVRPGVRFGKPLDFSRYYGLEHDRLVQRAVTDEIIYEIMKLSGQEYVDEYAARHKALQQAEKRAHRLEAAAKARAAAASAVAGGIATARGGRSPRTDDAGAASPETAGPEAAAGTEAASTQAAGHEAAGTEAAGTEAAGIDAADPRAAGADAGGSEAADSDAAGSEAAGLGAAGPGAAGPEAAGPEAGGPGTAGPGAAGRNPAPDADPKTDGATGDRAATATTSD
jgi:1-acyl-sn-glycerol-3-phosphate acyltransferase